MNTTRQEQIEAYLDGKLSDEARSAFEIELNQNEALRNEVASERFMRKGLKALAFKEAFQKMHNDMNETPVIPLQNQPRKAGVFKVSTNKNWFKTYYAVAACLAAVAVGLWYFSQQNSGVSNEKEIAIDKPTNVPKIQNSKQPTDSTQTKEPDSHKQVAAKLPAEDFLNEQEQTHLLSENQIPIDLSLTPAECQGLFQRYFEQDLVSDEALKKGINAMQKGGDGLSIFQEIVSTTTNDNLRQKAQWLATLVYVKDCNTKEALKLSNSIRQIDGHLFQNQAKKLYKRLR